MEVKLMVKVVAWAPVFNAVFLCIMATFCFALALHKGTVSIYVPSISETGSTTPSLYFFMFGTMISSISVSIVVIYKYLVLRYYIGSGKKKLHRYNIGLFVIGLLSAFALLSLTPFPLSLNREAHTAIAITHFVLCMCYTCLDTFVNLKTRHLHPAMRALRLGLCIAHVILSVLFVTLYPVARRLFLKYNENEDVKEPGDKMFAFFFMACLFEWLMYITFMIYLVTFTPEFLGFQLALEAVPVNTPDNDASNNNPQDHDVISNEANQRDTMPSDITDDNVADDTKRRTSPPDVVVQNETHSVKDNSSDENLSSKTKK